METIEIPSEAWFRSFFQPLSLTEIYEAIRNLYVESTILISHKEYLMLKGNSMALRKLGFHYERGNRKIILHVVELELADESEQKLAYADQYLVRYRMTELQIAKPVARGSIGFKNGL